MGDLGERFHKSPEAYARKVAGWRAARARAHAGEGFIYVATIGRKVVKIGFSLDPAKRIRAMGVRYAGKRRLLAAIPGTWREEKALHRQLDRDPAALGYEFYHRSILTHEAIPEGLRSAA